ncbi:unnamed protein product [Blepharisma stoltei]|uniref:protein-serine/threonine phosphatase n=1 Tax=Blepharisma stoltei TaxID=1481888 RepID=A0AAU9IPE1_9CILI|nr:unnamed protein product [Blepharisma stoltei]
MSAFLKSLKAPSSDSLPSIRSPRGSETPTPRFARKSQHGKISVSSNSVPSLNTLPELKHNSPRNIEVSQTYPQLPLTDRLLPQLQPSAISSSSCGKVKAYAANTNQGLTRQYNEDKAIIILRIKKPQLQAKKDWPDCSFFGLYDGHGGKTCSNFLRENLHQYIINDPLFPDCPKQAILRGFEQAETDFLKLAKQTGEKSGSCALISLVIGDTCYVANVGDSRAIMSGCGGQQAITITKDHKPSDPEEQVRVQKEGGKIYYHKNSPNIVYRVSPGGLSVSRTIGDLDAKDSEFGGNPNVIIAKPEIKSFKIKKDHDFMVLGCDGIFDVMNTQEVVSTAWNSNFNSDELSPNFCRNAVEGIVTQSMRRRSGDNLTAIIIAFDNFESRFMEQAKC